MKNLKDIILEKLKIKNKETPDLNIYDVDRVINFLSGDDIKLRQIAIDVIREEVIDYGCQRIKTTNKIKGSDSYFIKFSKIRIDSETPDSLTFLSLISYDNYCNIIINADDNIYNKNIKIYREPWSRTQPNLSPKIAEIYEIPIDCPVYEICKTINSKKF